MNKKAQLGAGPRGVSNIISAGFGLIIAIIAFIGLAISKGYFAEKLSSLPVDPTSYFIVLIVLGILFIIFSMSSKKYIS